jgi:DNA (cytosine-5)-methyltransferase 1
MTPLTVGSLFSGIGGLELGLERAGMEVKWQVEIDDYCRRVLAKHWPDVARYEDVREVGAHNLEPVDLICGGFPCQDISIAGNGRGLQGERSGLWFEVARIVREIRPRFLLVENVAALAHRGLDRVLGDLAWLGYDAEWSVLSACAVGAPHPRERMFVVAYRDGIGRGCAGHSVQRRDGVPPRFGHWQAAPPDPRWENVVRWIESIVETGGGIAPASERGGLVDGVPARLDRIAAAGNAVVPQVAEYIGRRIVEADAALRESEAA